MSKHAGDGTVLVVGAGVAGSVAARRMAEAGLRVTLLDKGRGPGGRLSTRRRGGAHYDHGCQVVRIDAGPSGERVRQAVAAGALVQWEPRVLRPGGTLGRPTAPWWTGTGGMNAFVHWLHEGLAVRFDAHVTALERDGIGWVARGPDGTVLGAGDRLVVAIPAPQARRLLAPVEPHIAAALESVRFDPVWTWMGAGLDVDVPYDVAIEPDPDVGWLAREASRPGRADHNTWTVHASPMWSRARIDMDPDEVEPLLRGLAARHLGGSLTTGVAHRWRFGLVARPLGRDHLCSSDGGLVVCGDGLLGERVEHAIASGAAAAEALIAPRHRADAADIERSIIALLALRAPTASVCPSEVASRIDPDAWRPLMEPVRQAAGRLAARGVLEVTQRGRAVDPETARGPIRLRLVAGSGERAQSNSILTRVPSSAITTSPS
jgi:predicted NAD/FAD-dependent oxidoreductase